MTPMNGAKYAVGGHLAEPGCAVKGVTDWRYFRLVNGNATVPVFVTEMKRAIKFPTHHLWHRNSRGCQAISGMYWVGAPMLLMTQEQCHVLIESDLRDTFYIYKCNA